jgi:hypothetical protein
VTELSSSQPSGYFLSFTPPRKPLPYPTIPQLGDLYRNPNGGRLGFSH